jgi:prepilin-type processing-associated H-X9-DG protein
VSTDVFPEERVMNESTEKAQTSRFAEASHRLGVLALFLLVLSACFILGPAVGVGRSGGQVLTREDRNLFSWGEVICQGLAGVAALAAVVRGIVALVEVRQGAGKVKGRGQAVSGLATGTLTSLTLVVGYSLVMPILSWKARKLESANNLKELGLAMHEYHEFYGHFPPAVLRDPGLGDRGQPYSWRVALLPLLGEKELFSQYRRDEPWDSPANKAVLARMPRVLAAPGRGRAADGLTHYQILVGPGTAFERPDARVRLWNLPHEPEQTILVVEAAVPVPWTSPEDLSYAPDGPLPKVGGLVGNGFHALFADGSVRWFEAEQQESALRTLVPRNGP